MKGNVSPAVVAVVVIVLVAVIGAVGYKMFVAKPSSGQTSGSDPERMKRMLDPEAAKAAAAGHIRRR